MVAHESHFPDDFRVIGRDRAAFARRDGFYRMEAERADVGEGARHPAIARGAEGVAGIGNQPDPPACSSDDRPKRLVIGRLTAVVHRYNRLGAGRDFPLNVCGVNKGGIRLDIGKNRRTSAIKDTIGGGNERDRWNDDLVSRGSANRGHGAVERSGSAIDDHGMPNSDEFRQSPLKFGDLRASRKPIGA